MKINFNQSVIGIKNEELKWDNRVVTLKLLSVEGLLSPRLTESLPGREKRDRYALARRIETSDVDVEVSADELSKIVASVEQSFGPAVCGPACDLLEK